MNFTSNSKVLVTLRFDAQEHNIVRGRCRHQFMHAFLRKMYLLRSQLDVDATLFNGLTRFCNFVSIFYAPYWLQCPLASEAAVNDLEFHRAVMIDELL